MRQIFHSLPWIPDPEPDELRKLYEEFGVPMTFRNGDLLKQKGAQNKSFLIVEGLAAYYIADRYKSHPSVLNLLIPGRSACDLSALLEKRVNVTTRAIGSCTALMVPPSLIRNAMEKDAKLATLVAQHVLRKSECSIEAMVANFTLEPSQRLKTFLCVIFESFKQPVHEGWNQVPLRLNNQQYGAIVNLTRVSVSRLFSEWASKELLKKEGSQLWIRPEIFEGVYDWLNGLR